MTDARRPSFTLPTPGLVATFEGRDCLMMPLFPGEETSIDLGPYTLTIRTPGDKAAEAQTPLERQYEVAVMRKKGLDRFSLAPRRKDSTQAGADQ